MPVAAPRTLLDELRAAGLPPPDEEGEDQTEGLLDALAAAGLPAPERPGGDVDAGLREALAAAGLPEPEAPARAPAREPERGVGLGPATELRGPAYVEALGQALEAAQAAAPDVRTVGLGPATELRGDAYTEALRERVMGAPPPGDPALERSRRALGIAGGLAALADPVSLVTAVLPEPTGTAAEQLAPPPPSFEHGQFEELRAAALAGGGFGRGVADVGKAVGEAGAAFFRTLRDDPEKVLAEFGDDPVGMTSVVAMGLLGGAKSGAMLLGRAGKATRRLQAAALAKTTGQPWGEESIRDAQAFIREARRLVPHGPAADTIRVVTAKEAATLPRGSGPVPRPGDPPISFAAPAAPDQRVLRVVAPRTGVRAKAVASLAQLPDSPWDFAIDEGTRRVVGLVPRPVRDVLGKRLVFRYGNSDDFNRVLDSMQSERIAWTNDAEDSVRTITSWPKAERELIGAALRGETELGALPVGKREFAEKIRDDFIALGAAKVDLGLIPEKSFVALYGRYLPRLYEKWEKQKLIRPGSLLDRLKAEMFGEAGQRGESVKFHGVRRPIKFQYAERNMRRQDIPEEVRRVVLGELLDPTLPIAKGLIQSGHDVAVARFFRSVAANKAWAAEADQGGWVVMSADKKKLGDLAGKWVHPSVADDIQALTSDPTFLGFSVPRWYQQALGMWKYGKVVLNPATHSRNFLSNVILADMGGLSPYRLDVYHDAIRELRARGPLWQEARASGVFGGEYLDEEIKGLLRHFVLQDTSAFDAGMAGARAWTRTPARLYQANDHFFRFSLYSHARKNMGMTVEEAARHARKHLLDYSARPEFIRGLSMVMPFVTFSYKALPVLAAAAVRNPIRFWKYPLMLSAANATGKVAIGPDAELRPEWMERGAFLTLPTRDRYGRTAYLDLSYILPWGDILDADNTARALFGGANPLAQLVAEFLVPLFGYSRTHEPPRQWWNGRPIFEHVDPPAVKHRKVLNYVSRVFLPTPVSTSAQKVWASYKGRGDYQGRVRNMATVLADVVFGLKVQPVDPASVVRQRVGRFRAEQRESVRERKWTAGDRGLSDEERLRLTLERNESDARRIEDFGLWSHDTLGGP